jgi:hypothetical protein
MFIHYSVSLIYFSVSEIKGLTTEIEQATSRGTLVRFFNSTDDASSLKSHNENLDRIISEANVSELVQLALTIPYYNGKACCRY